MLKEYVIDLRGYDGKLRELISTGLQEHGYKLGYWTSLDGVKSNIPAYVDRPFIYFGVKGQIYYANAPMPGYPSITPADFLALTPEDVQDNSGTASASCTDRPIAEPTVWDGAPSWATEARVKWTNPDYPVGMNETYSKLYSREAELKKPKFEPKQWILGRNNPAEHWTLDIFSHTDYADEYGFIRVCIGTCWAEIIPYEGNEHLCGQVGEP